MISLGHYNVMLIDFRHLNDKSCHISFSALKKGPVGSAAREPLDIAGGAGGEAPLPVLQASCSVVLGVGSPYAPFL